MKSKQVTCRPAHTSPLMPLVSLCNSCLEMGHFALKKFHFSLCEMGKCKLLDGGGDEMRGGLFSCRTLIGLENMASLTPFWWISVTHYVALQLYQERDSTQPSSSQLVSTLHLLKEKGLVRGLGNWSPQLWVSSGSPIHSLIVHTSILSWRPRVRWWLLMRGLWCIKSLNSLLHTDNPDVLSKIAKQ